MKSLFLVIALVSMGRAFADERDDLASQLAHDLAQFNKVLQSAPESQGTIAGYIDKWPQVVVTSEKARVYAGADEKAKTVEKPSTGRVYRVVDKADSWYAVVPIYEIEDFHVQMNMEDASGWISAKDVKFLPAGDKDYQTAPVYSPAETVYKELSRMAIALKEKYQNNPYIMVKGFDIQLSLPPAASISFEFKQ